MNKPSLLHICISICLLMQVGLNAQPPKRPFKLALVQMKVVGGDRTSNLTHAGEMIDEAVANGADFVLLP